MSLVPIPHYDGPEGSQKIPLCQKCFDKPAVVFCKECGCPLCMDCQKNHVCLKKKEEFN